MISSIQMETHLTRLLAVPGPRPMPAEHGWDFLKTLSALLPGWIDRHWARLDSFRFDAGFQQSMRYWRDMFHAEIDTSQRVLTMSFAHRVDSREMKACLEKVRTMLADIKPGFRLLTDLTSLESMDADCSTDLGEMMSLCDAKGISAVLTVVPNPKKDIGFTVMEPFHYGEGVLVKTYDTLADAIQSLAA